MSAPRNGDPVAVTVNGIYRTAGTGADHTINVETAPGQHVCIPSGHASIAVTGPNDGSGTRYVR